MRSRPPPDEHGFALLLVLLLTLVLLPFAVEFSMQVALETRTAINVTDELKIENAIDGQYEIMLAHLRYDILENDIDSWDDVWNDEQLVSRTEEDVNVALTTHVFDEQAKFNLRTLTEGPQERQMLQRKRLRALLQEFRRDTEFELSSGEAEAWSRGIIEWVTKGAVRTNVPSPRMEDGRTILVLEELLLLPEVQGEHFDTILYDRRDGERVAPGLHRFLTVYGTGKVNLNTCELALLRAYFPQNPDAAERIIDHRESPPEGEEDTSTTDEETSGNPFTDVMQVAQIDGITPEILQGNGVDPSLDFDVLSNVFSFRIVGETDTSRRDELFVVERVPGASEEEPLEGFRLRLRQERTDVLEQIEKE